MKIKTANPVTIDPKSDRDAQARGLGTTMRKLRQLPERPTAAQLREAGYDYHAHGQTYRQALDTVRTLRESYNQPQVLAKMYACNHRGCPAKWPGSGDSVYRDLARSYGNLADEEYIRRKHANEACRRRNARAERQRRIEYFAGLLVSPPRWLDKALAWDNSRMDLLLADGRRISTIRRENAQWDRGSNKHWPSSTSVSYHTGFVQPNGEPISGAPGVTHDCRGNWRYRVLRELGLTSADDKTDMHLRLNPCCTTREGHGLPDGTRIGERLLCGARVDYYARTEDNKTAYHADTVADAVAGLQRKLRHAEAARRGKLLTANIAHERWGFCLPGLREFAEAAGLDVSGEYELSEVRQAVTPEIRERFACYLAVAGI